MKKNAKGRAVGVVPRTLFSSALLFALHGVSAAAASNPIAAKGTSTSIGPCFDGLVLETPNAATELRTCELPPDTKSFQVFVCGARGGQTSTSSLGASIQTTRSGDAINGIKMLGFAVGGPGTVPSSPGGSFGPQGGINGGGVGGGSDVNNIYPGGSGGGWTGVFLNPPTSFASVEAAAVDPSVMIIAGGGGGGLNSGKAGGDAGRPGTKDNSTFAAQAPSGDAGGAAGGTNGGAFGDPGDVGQGGGGAVVQEANIRAASGGGGGGGGRYGGGGGGFGETGAGGSSYEANFGFVATPGVEACTGSGSGKVTLFLTLEPAPTPTATPTATPTVKPSATPTPTTKPTTPPSATPTPTVKPSATPTPTATPTVKPSATPTPTTKPTTKPSATPTPTATPDTDSDNDGVKRSQESQVPNPSGTGKGDGNGDGKADDTQSEVSSLLDFDKSAYLTVVSVADRQLSMVKAVDVPADFPADAIAPYSGVTFTLLGVTPGGDETIEIYAPFDAAINGLLKKNRLTGQWDNVAASVSKAGTAKTMITLTLKDGGPYDADGLANGVIVDPALPAILKAAVSPTPAPAGGGGGAFGGLLFAMVAGVAAMWRRLAVPRRY